MYTDYCFTIEVQVKWICVRFIMVYYIIYYILYIYITVFISLNCILSTQVGKHSFEL